MLPILFSCTVPSPDAADSGDTPEVSQDVPYIFEEEEPPVPTLSADQLAATIVEGVGAVWGYSATPVFSAYEAGMSGSSEGCPNYYDYDGSAYWYDSCTSAGGTEFSGYSFYQQFHDWDAGDGSIYNGASLSGVGSITSPDSSRLEFGGSAYQIVITSQLALDDPSYYSGMYLVIQGGFSGTGAGAEGTWLDGDAGPDLALYTYYAPSYDGRAVSLEGSLGGLAGGAEAVVFDSLYLMSPNLVPDCPGEPYGVVSVRDAEGSWYDVVFDGPETYESDVDPDLCDGCGEAYFRGEALGPVCGVDFTGLLTPPEAE